jgi:hypothetical protein
MYNQSQLANMLAIATAAGVSVDKLFRMPQRDWKSDPDRLAAAEAKRARKQARNQKK